MTVDPKHSEFSQPVKGLLFGLGCFSLALGVVGIFVPLLPTTPFIILSAWCFLRSSKRFHHWLMTHPKFGPMVTAWNERGAIPMAAKRLAFFTIGSSLIVIWFTVPSLSVRLGVTGLLVAVTVYVLTRPKA